MKHEAKKKKKIHINNLSSYFKALKKKIAIQRILTLEFNRNLL